jgi:TonB-dependent starch-binding outer membrane protein SusC
MLLNANGKTLPCLSTKTLLIMKFTVVFVLVACLQVKATTFAQNVTLNVRNASLEQVFGELKKQSGYNFFYNDAMLKAGLPVTIDVKGMPFEEALKECLANQPLSFSIVNKTVVLKDKVLQPDFLAVQPQPEDYHGRVTDSLRNGLVGATVRVKGTKYATVTDPNGNFVIKASELPEHAVLTVSYTGYNTLELPAFRNGGVAQYEFTLKRSTNPLDAVQVIAYGTNTKRYSIGNVTTVTAEDIATSGATNIVNALDGRVPGMQISQFSGAPGARSTMQVRGQNTLKSTMATSGTPFDQPMIIVDGVPFAAQNSDISLFLSTFISNNGTGTMGFSSLNGINPADIESVSVLKDADATSIYGSQGANGVIVITTKRGKPGTSTFNVRVNTGPSKISRGLDMMNTQQYLAMRHQAIAADGLTVDQDPNTFYDLTVFDTTKYTDWAKKYFSGTANTTDAHISMSGGTTQSTYMVAAGYTKATYNFPGDFSDQRYTLHSSVGTRSLNGKFRMDFGADFSYDNNNSPENPALGTALSLVPNRPDMTDDKGNLVWVYKGIDISSTQMLAYQKQFYTLQNFGMNDYVRMSYLIAKGLTITANAGYSLGMTKQYAATPLASLQPLNGTTASADFGRSDAQTLNLEPQIDYKTTIGRGDLSVLVGGTYKKVINSSDNQTADGYADDALLRTITAATNVSAYDNYSIYKYAGAFGRLGYVWDGKYIASFTGRRDGSSNFGPGHRWGTFASAGLGWIISEESFFENLKPTFSFLKLSGNYGTQGSDGNAPYNFQPYWKVANPSQSPNFDNVRPFTPVNLYNPNYSWASKKAINLGIDLGFLNDKLLLNATYYRDRTSNQITSYTLPTQTGFTSVVENMNATLQNSGLEFTITSRNITHQNFSWVTSFNISGNRNKLIAFPGLASSPYASFYSIGKSTTTVWGFKSAGVNDTTGVYQFYTSKGTITSRPSTTTVSSGGDVMPILDAKTDFFGGITNGFTYKHWSLALFFKFSKALSSNYLKGLGYNSQLPGQMFNLPVELQGKYWTKPGDHTPLQRLSSGSYMASDPNAQLAQRTGSYFSTSSGVYSDDTFLRLKSVSLSYSLGPDALKRAHIKGCTFNLQAQNLLTFTNYKFGDPEMPGILYTVPLQLMIEGGISIDL